MRRRLAITLTALALLGAGCTSLPPPADRTASWALEDTSDTRLGRLVAPEAAAHPGRTGIYAYDKPYPAFAARIALAGVAQRSLDAQYFIWHRDQVGLLLLEAFWQAAERGVRVRLLLDDNNTVGLDPLLAALDAHPNIELRLYNPFVRRDARTLGFVTDFTRLNHRMHNKAFVADNQVFIVGGRNIGNEYFGAGHGIQFADIGVVGVGAGVREVSREFDGYWNSASAYPAASIVPAGTALSAAELQARFAAVHADPEARAYLDAVYADPQVQELLAAKVPFEWTTVQLLYDDPAKTLDTEERRELRLYPKLRRALGTPKKSVELMSPYFVPGDNGTAELAALARSGVQVRVLTNSLASTDEIAVHAGYAPRRRELLAAGVQLYELKPTATQPPHKSRARFGLGSASALHAKSVAVDRERVFVGSYNLDRRSGELNTEMGLVIDSPTLAGTLAEAFDNEVAAAAYEVRLAPDGRSLIWIERTKSGEEIRHDTEPGTTWSMRMAIELLSILPFEWML